MSALELNAFQILLLVALGLLQVGIIMAMVSGWVTRRDGSAWGSLILLAGIATLWPKLTGRVAGALGIGRGADLVFYCAVVVMMIGFWLTYMRLRHLRRELTLLVRHIALLEAQENPTPNDVKRTQGPSRHKVKDD